jgi:uncharacterized protein (TIGR00303 family)
MPQERVAFILVIATTDVSMIPGTTIAGATPELTMYTPAADAEFLINGKCDVIKGVPITPDGIPSPAIISRASLNLTGIPTFVVNAGAKVRPLAIPFFDVGGEPGKDIRSGALEMNVVERILNNSMRLGEQLSRGFDRVIIGESIPAGTTTAMSTLVALGYNAFGKVSSASPDNPMELKEKIVREALSKVSYEEDKIARLSDPMIISASGIAQGFQGKIVLAGGTQMTAVAALTKKLAPMKLKDMEIWTTKWIVSDKSSDILGLASQIGVKVEYSPLDFSKSKFEGLRVYEKGYVKEGVGAGGLSLFAIKMGFTTENILKEVEKVYEEAKNEKI